MATDTGRAGYNHDGVRNGADQWKPVGKQSKSHVLKRHGKRNHRPHLKWPHLARPITTPSAIKLFFELYEKHTSRNRTSWDEMAVDWNTRLGGSFEILGELTRDNTLHFTTPAYLRKFEEQLVMREVGKTAVGYFHTIDTVMHSHRPSQPSVTQHSPLSQQRDQNAPFNTSSVLTRAPTPSRQKVNNQGGGGVAKKCAACAKNGKDVLLTGHKKVCPYKKS